jgi:hypothetical protein
VAAHYYPGWLVRIVLKDRHHTIFEFEADYETVNRFLSEDSRPGTEPVYMLENKQGRTRAIISQKTALTDPIVRVSASIPNKSVPWRIGCPESSGVKKYIITRAVLRSSFFIGHLLKPGTG